MSAKLVVAGYTVSITDNFLEVIAAGAFVQDVAEKVLAYVDTLIQSLSSMYGQRFFASLLVAEDEVGTQQAVQVAPRKIKLFDATVYNTQELSERLVSAAKWASSADDVARKALFYFEHACLLNEFSESLPFSSPHAAFSRASAFLQLFKALTVIIGDPSSDRDYQSRCRKLGLQRDFWQVRAKPLYDIRNDEDVAHYTRALPERDAFIRQYSEAASVFREALEAHIKALITEKAAQMI